MLQRPGREREGGGEKEGEEEGDRGIGEEREVRGKGVMGDRKRRGGWWGMGKNRYAF